MEIDVEKLPIIELIESLIGAEMTRRLINLRGGTRIYVPAYAKPRHRLTKDIGIEATQKLGDHFRVGKTGAYFLLPKGARTADQYRLQILEMADSGISAERIALAMDLHERSVFRALQNRAKRVARLRGAEIIKLRQSDKDEKQIAAALGISVRAVKGALRYLPKR